MTVHRWENCNFVSEVRMFGMCIGLEACYFVPPPPRALWNPYDCFGKCIGFEARFLLF